MLPSAPNSRELRTAEGAVRKSRYTLRSRLREGGFACRFRSGRERRGRKEMAQTRNRRQERDALRLQESDAVIFCWQWLGWPAFRVPGRQVKEWGSSSPSVRMRVCGRHVASVELWWHHCVFECASVHLENDVAAPSVVINDVLGGVEILRVAIYGDSVRMATPPRAPRAVLGGARRPYVVKAAPAK